MKFPKLEPFSEKKFFEMFSILHASSSKPSKNTLQASMNSIYSLEHPFHPNIHEVKRKKYKSLFLLRNISANRIGK